jgi:hypothetical protein
MKLTAPRRYFPHGVGCACWRCIWLIRDWVLEAEEDREIETARGEYAAAQLSLP